MSLVILTLNGFVLPEASPVHPEKAYPSAGVAVSETLAFSLWVSPGSFTLPPSEAVTTKVKVAVGSGVGTTASGIGLSLEQDKIIKKTSVINFFIVNIVCVSTNINKPNTLYLFFLKYNCR